MDSVKIWKVGELASATGVSVRALHHYDEIGLLPPSHRTGANHRLYTEDDIRRLQCIISLRSLGFSLEQAGYVLSTHDCSPMRIIEMQMTQLREQTRRQLALLDRLKLLHNRLRKTESPGVDKFFELIKEIETMESFKQCYTTEQLAALEERARQVTPERMEEVQQEWHELIALVRTQMDANADVNEPHVQQLAKRWMGLIAEFTGGRKDIAQSLSKVYKHNPTVASDRGFAIDAEMMAYVGKAWAEMNFGTD